MRNRKNYNQDPRWIVARFAGKCSRCGSPIGRGSRGFYYPKTKTLYCEAPACGAQESARFDAEAADESFMQSQFPGGYERDPSDW